MTQLLQNIYILAPYIFTLVLIVAAITGVWLIVQLKKSGTTQHFPDRLYMKRNAARLGKMQLPTFPKYS